MSVFYTDLSRSLMNLECYKRYSAYMALKNSGLYFGQSHILEYLVDKGASKQKDIASAMRVSPASIAVSVKRLQKNGMIVKVNDENDMRSNKISITDKGIQCLEEINEKFKEIEKTLYTGFTQEELEQFKGFVDRMSDNLYSKIPDKSDVINLYKPDFNEKSEKNEGEG